MRTRFQSIFRTISWRMWGSSVRSATPCFNLAPQRPQLTEFLKAEAVELLLPAVERLLADAEPATDLGDLLAAFDLVQGVDDLSFVKMDGRIMPNPRHVHQESRGHAQYY